MGAAFEGDARLNLELGEGVGFGLCHFSIGDIGRFGTGWMDGLVEVGGGW